MPCVLIGVHCQRVLSLFCSVAYTCLPLQNKQIDKQIDKLVGMLISNRSKVRRAMGWLYLMHTPIVSLPRQIDACIQCGKLKNAYLHAIRAKMVDEVRKISDIASRAGQLTIRDICEKWLQANTHAR